MARFKDRIKARTLRKKGVSICEISRRMDISKGTISLWCGDLKLTKKQKDKIFRKMVKSGHRGRIIGAEMNHKKKLDNIEYFKNKGIIEVGKLSKRDLMLIGASLYWAEGSKKGSGGFSFVNSDPEMIKIIYLWIKQILGVPKSDLIVRIAINEIHKQRMSKVLNFWSNLLELQADCFRNTFFIKNRQKKVYDNYENYYGTLVIRISKGTLLKYKILGIIEGVKHAGVAQLVRASHS